MAAESETVRHGHADLPFPGLVRRVVQVARRVRVFQVDRRRDEPIAQAQDRQDRFHAAAGSQQVAQLALRAGDAQGAGVFLEDRLDGDGYTLGEQVQYTDIWTNDNYLQFVYERFLLIKELLSEDGSIYLHCDWHADAYIRVYILDKIFGENNFHGH